MILSQGRTFKEYRGMGSIGAMRRGSRDRYFQDDFELESGTGPAGKGARKSSCPKASRGASSTRAASRWSSIRWSAACARAWGIAAPPPLPVLQRDAQMIRITQAGFRESHVHDVTITKEAPNYGSE